MGKQITVGMCEALLKLSKEEREALAELLSRGEALTGEELSRGLSQALQDETRKQMQRNREQAAILETLPAAVWAAHVLEELDELSYDLAQIMDAARETAAGGGSTEEIEGHYKMLIEAAGGITDRIMKALTVGTSADVLHIVRLHTKKPAED